MRLGEFPSRKDRRKPFPREVKSGTFTVPVSPVLSNRMLIDVKVASVPEEGVMLTGVSTAVVLRDSKKVNGTSPPSGLSNAKKTSEVNLGASDGCRRRGRSPESWLPPRPIAIATVSVKLQLIDEGISPLNWLYDSPMLMEVSKPPEGVGHSNQEGMGPVN